MKGLLSGVDGFADLHVVPGALQVERTELLVQLLDRTTGIHDQTHEAVFAAELGERAAGAHQRAEGGVAGGAVDVPHEAVHLGKTTLEGRTAGHVTALDLALASTALAGSRVAPVAHGVAVAVQHVVLAQAGFGEFDRVEVELPESGGGLQQEEVAECPLVEGHLLHEFRLEVRVEPVEEVSDQHVGLVLTGHRLVHLVRGGVRLRRFSDDVAGRQVEDLAEPTTVREEAVVGTEAGDRELIEPFGGHVQFLDLLTGLGAAAVAFCFLDQPLCRGHQEVQMPGVPPQHVEGLPDPHAGEIVQLPLVVVEALEDLLEGLEDVGECPRPQDHLLLSALHMTGLSVISRSVTSRPLWASRGEWQ
ncbi:MAG: hypothetical protein COV59_01135 [Candidatus Magasanikbacteria bacterium CG11_big_fil_rev_8_21_14_0_20_39_34]|uniref:Uncharacterized protein n=1 Tax=Candidatus Magasanikbacteria bacterium CG11_big_fil_rev_8_21_14_0_20_39_34 TaxID=1974653 RepID=A0A2H0N6B4_9BACT|nr:MAG: hypothetical protein COV59_01135 [Candidatus Magasanikbacteria bacterium CG11_big_fil_rev_8_21_14_0_20_39_34]